MARMQITPGTEVLGLGMLSALDNVRSNQIRPIMQQLEIDNIQPDQWYPMAPYIELLYRLGEGQNPDENMVAMGLKVPSVLLSSEMLENMTMESWLGSWNEQYQSSHRGGYAGEIVVEKIDEHHYRTIHRNPYPDAFTYGIAYGFAREILPYGTKFTVQYEDIFNRMDYGDADETVIIIKWEL